MSDNYLILKRELRALLDDDFKRGRELLPFFRLANSERPGRQGRYHKGPFALFWLYINLSGDWQRRLTLLSQEFGASPPPLVRRRQKRAIPELENLLYKLVEDEQDLFDSLFGDIPEVRRIISRFKKNPAVIRALIDPEIADRKELQALSDSLEQKRNRIKNLPYQEVVFIFSDLLEMGPKRRQEIVSLWRQVRNDDRLTGMVFHFIRDHMKHKDHQIKLRELQRRFTKTKAELAPILERLRDHRLIVLDQGKKTVTIRSYDPENSRIFKWLAESTWPRSPFEPYLEKWDPGGKMETYLVRDFRQDVVEEWVKTGAAAYI